MSNETHLGTVIRFSSIRGYGFLRSEQCDKDVFVHWSAIEMDGYKALREGQRVEFILEQGPKGLQAGQVKVIK
jgi:cold shock protein